MSVQFLIHPFTTQEHIELDELVVVRYWVLDLRRSAQCGSLSTGVRQSVMAFVTRAI